MFEIAMANEPSVFEPLQFNLEIDGLYPSEKCKYLNGSHLSSSAYKMGVSLPNSPRKPEVLEGRSGIFGVVLEWKTPFTTD